VRHLAGHANLRQAPRGAVLWAGLPLAARPTCGLVDTVGIHLLIGTVPVLIELIDYEGRVAVHLKTFGRAR
jgi:hypothetical protein